ncbi:hypothetical protein ACFPZK_10040 [Psychrobacter urativorans]|uniref:hypothetical protein n=1 Tax=Psychrobacter urativorans TaxID=45610 RepID=UPI001917A557|nr:hypothetical protein [Psychrobacter urativorans]
MVLPDDRPHQEQEVMSQALINQGRALSWQQFKILLSHKQTHTNPNEQSVNKAPIKSISKSSHANRNEDYLTAAKAFMDSTTEYPTTKAWFEQWLLPKLKLNPDY